MTKAGPKTKILIGNQTKLTHDILEILISAGGSQELNEILEELWKRGYLAYDPEG